MTDSRPLVWLPFDADLLGAPPPELRYEKFLPGVDGQLPATVDQVEFYVPPYGFSSGDSDVLKAMSALEVVQSMSAGVDHLRRYVPVGVLLCNGRGIHNASTAELTLTLILASLRGIPDFVRAQDRGQWCPQTLTSLADTSVLILGYGAIGAAIEDRLAGFEVDVTRVARTARDGVHGYGDLDALVPQADVVVLIVPITAETRSLVDAGFLARMKDGALLVNMARGPVVDTDALVAELSTGRISAALDVTDPEPLPRGHPLWSAPNLLISPHVGGASSAMKSRAYKLVREQLERFAHGEPLVNVMTGEY